MPTTTTYESEYSMPFGTVKFDDRDGFGFFAPDDGAPELFVHYTGIAERAGGGRRSLDPGQRVGYTLSEGPKGPQAADVRAVC